MSVRDSSSREQMSTPTPNVRNMMVFELNHQKKVIEHWEELIILFEGKTYKPQGKPDEYNYTTLSKGSMVIQALEFTDNNSYTEDMYKEAL